MNNRVYPEHVKSKAVEMFMELVAHDHNISRCARQVQQVYGVSRPVLVGWARDAGHTLTPTHHAQQQLQSQVASLRARVEQLEKINAELEKTNRDQASKIEALTEVLSRAHDTTTGEE